MNAKLPTGRAIVTADLRIKSGRSVIQLTPETAFSVARQLLERGTRRIVAEEISRSGSARRGTR
jgi:hypothetical protein